MCVYGIPGGLSTAVVIHFSITGEDDKADLGITQHRELMSLLEKPGSAFCKGHLPCGFVLYPRDGNLPPSHDLFENKLQKPSS